LPVYLSHLIHVLDDSWYFKESCGAIRVAVLNVLVLKLRKTSMNHITTSAACVSLSLWIIGTAVASWLDMKEFLQSFDRPASDFVPFAGQRKSIANPRGERRRREKAQDGANASPALTPSWSTTKIPRAYLRNFKAVKLVCACCEVSDGSRWNSREPHHHSILRSRKTL